MRVYAPAALAFALTWCVLSPARTLADPFHYQTLPLGQRALGMGGAFTGLADDPSAAYYNPAGLALIPDSALSASLTINAFDRRSIDRGYRTSIGDASLKHESQPSLPVFVTLVKKVGRRDADRKRRHAVALSTFTVDQRRLAFDVELRGQAMGEDVTDTFSTEREDSTVWNGVSYAYRISPRVSFGLSGFLSHTRTRYTQEHIAVTLGPLDTSDGSFENRSALWQTYRTRTDVRNVVMRLGLLYDSEDKLRLGIMFQPASIHIRGTADVRTRILTSDNVASPAAGRFMNVSETGLPSRSPIPWELRLGSSYKLLTWVTVALDASLYGASGSRAYPVVAVGPRSPDPETGAVAGVGDLALDTWVRRMTGNVSLGGEAVIDNTVALRGGFFTSLSAAPDVPHVSSTYAPADVNLFGGAVSAGYVANGYDLSLGLAGLFGRGDALAFAPDAQPAEAYHRTTVKDRMLFVFLSGAKSAVSRLALSADKKLQELRREQAAEAARAEREAARAAREAERDAARDRPRTRPSPE